MPRLQPAGCRRYFKPLGLPPEAAAAKAGQALRDGMACLKACPDTNLAPITNLAVITNLALITNLA